MNIIKNIKHPKIILGGFLALMMLSTISGSYSYILDSIKIDLSLNYTQIGSLMSAYFLGYTFGQIPWGFLADRYGGRKIISSSVFLASIVTGFFGYSSNFFLAFLTRFLSGLLGAGVFVPSVKMISGWYKSGERGTALGLMNIGGSVGLILITWISPLLATLFNWRNSLVIQCIFGVTLSSIIWLSIRDGVTSKTNARIELRTAFTRSSFWILAFAQFIRLGCYYTFIAWLPQVFKEDYNLNVLTISGAMSLFNIAGMISNPIGGMLSDKIGEKTVMLISFSFLSIGLLGFVVIPLGDFLFLESFLLGWFINFIRSPSFTIIPRFFGLEYAGSISGFQNTFASLGALFLPLVLGAVKDVTMSYSFGWIILIALIIINTILMVIMKIPVKADILLSSD